MRSEFVSLSAMTRTSLEVAPTPPGSVKVDAPGAGVMLVVVVCGVGCGWPNGALRISGGRCPGASEGAVLLVRREEKSSLISCARFSALPLRTWETYRREPPHLPPTRSRRA